MRNALVVVLGRTINCPLALHPFPFFDPIHKENDMPRFDCPACDLEFEKSHQLVDHISKKHPELAQKVARASLRSGWGAR